MIRLLHLLASCYETRIRTEVVQAMRKEADRHAGDACDTAVRDEASVCYRRTPLLVTMIIIILLLLLLLFYYYYYFLLLFLHQQ